MGENRRPQDGVDQPQRLLYAYLFEVRLNLDVLGAVKKEALAGLGAGSPAFVSLAESLETAAGLALLAGSDRRNYRRLVKLLKKHWQDDAAFEAEESAQKETAEGVLDAVSFSVRKIEALKRIAHTASRDAPFYPVFNLKTRLGNIETALLALSKVLTEILPKAEKRL